MNYNSGEYLLPCLASLRSQQLGGRSLEIVVVDNRSPLDQSGALAAARDAGARVVEAEHNGGWSGGCNLGFRCSQGELLFFLNADVLARPDTITVLADEIGRRGDCIVEPRTTLDPGGAFLIPGFEPLRWPGLLRETLASRSRPAVFRRGLDWLRRELELWRSTEPSVRPGLTGAFLGMNRGVFERIGGFDEGYPLYFEDFDLFRRATTAGIDLVHVPGASAVHFAHRSTATEWNESMEKSRQGRERYLRQHEGRLGPWVAKLCDALAKRWEQHRAEPWPAAIDLGACEAPPHLHWEGPRGPFVVQLAFAPDFPLAAGCFGEGDEWAPSAETWGSLLPAPYWLRVVELDELRVAGVWRVTRV